MSINFEKTPGVYHVPNHVPTSYYTPLPQVQPLVCYPPYYPPPSYQESMIYNDRQDTTLIVDSTVIEEEERRGEIVRDRKCYACFLLFGIFFIIGIIIICVLTSPTKKLLK